MQIQLQLLKVKSLISIHPFSSTYPGSGWGNSRLGRLFQTTVSPSNVSESQSQSVFLYCSSNRKFVAAPTGGGDQTLNPSSRFWVYSAISSHLHLPGETSTGRSPGGIQMSEPPLLAPFNAKEQQLYSNLPSDVLTLYLRPSPATLLRTAISFFPSLPRTNEQKWGKTKLLIHQSLNVPTLTTHLSQLTLSFIQLIRNCYTLLTMGWS